MAALITSRSSTRENVAVSRDGGPRCRTLRWETTLGRCWGRPAGERRASGGRRRGPSWLFAEGGEDSGPPRRVDARCPRAPLGRLHVVGFPRQSLRPLAIARGTDG